MIKMTLEEKRVDIKLGFLCNNNCLFCVQAHKKHLGNKSTAQIKKDLREAKETCTGVVFTGGEPTIREDIFDLVSYAKQLGFKVIQIQTNGRMLAYKKFCEKLIDAGATEFSPALHGHVAELHEFLTSSKGSFSQVVQGIKNVKQLGRKVIMNCVVTKPNYRYLPEIAKLFVKLGVDQYQFAFVHPVGNAYKNFDSIVPVISLAAPYVHQGLQIGIDNGISVMAEAMPYCMMQGYEDYTSERYIPNTEIREMDFVIKNYEEVRKKEGKMKFPQCKECKYDAICEGPWREYPEKKGFEEFKPVKDYTKLMRGSGFLGNYLEWEQARGLYLKLIEKPGKILDLGCANGFLLDFIIKSKKFNLIPFGVDLNEDLIKIAKELFPKYSANFVTQDINDFKSEEKFDYILAYFPFFKKKDFLKRLYSMLKNGGRIIIALYDEKANEFDIFEENIKETGFLPSGVIEEKNLTKLIWIDKN